MAFIYEIKQVTIPLKISNGNVSATDFKMGIGSIRQGIYWNGFNFKIEIPGAHALKCVIWALIPQKCNWKVGLAWRQTIYFKT